MALYALLDTDQKRFLEVFESGDKKLLMQELVDLYNKTTDGEKVTTFATVDEARSRTIEALGRRYFPEAYKSTTEKTAAEVGRPAPKSTEVQALGPVARARAIFEELGLGRPRKEHLAACEKLGIKATTAAAQYQSWKTAKKNAGHTAPQPAAH